MRKTAMLVSWLSLAALVASPVLFLAGSIGLETAKRLMVAASVLWFTTASLYMWNGKEP